MTKRGEETVGEKKTRLEADHQQQKWEATTNPQGSAEGTGTDLVESNLRKGVDIRCRGYIRRS